ncbi:MAG: hydrogenase expression/formation protein [Gammaproteobacteria bacterium]|nr:hydrogenase expression/formation protein [Gammaproteobacteria bacterium]
MAVLEALLSELYGYDGKLKPPIDLQSLDEANRELVDQVLGEGDVSVVIDGMARTLIQESVLAGVWRVRSTDDEGNMLSDHIEVASIPWAVRARSFDKAAAKIASANEALPEGGTHAINLSLLPQTEQDLAFLHEKLGPGKVVILSRGYGNCRITSTGTDKVWWVQYFNSQDSMILNTLEITAVPEVACAAPEDIADSAQRLNEILDVYRVEA